MCEYRNMNTKSSASLAMRYCKLSMFYVHVRCAFKKRCPWNVYNKYFVHLTTHCLIKHLHLHQHHAKWYVIGVYGVRNRYIGQINEAFKICSPTAWRRSLYTIRIQNLTQIWNAFIVLRNEWFFNRFYHYILLPPPSLYCTSTNILHSSVHIFLYSYSNICSRRVSGMFCVCTT